MMTARCTRPFFDPYLSASLTATNRLQKAAASHSIPHRQSIAGVILLEVILALVLFVAAAAILTATMNSSLASVERQRLSLQADNLASSILAEMQIGARPIEAGGTITFDPPLDDWAGEVAITPTETETGEASELSLVEVVVRHKGSPLVQRQSQWLNLPGGKSTPVSSPSE